MHAFEEHTGPLNVTFLSPGSCWRHDVTPCGEGKQTPRHTVRSQNRVTSKDHDRQHTVTHTHLLFLSDDW